MSLECTYVTRAVECLRACGLNTEDIDGLAFDYYRESSEALLFLFIFVQQQSVLQITSENIRHLWIIGSSMTNDDRQ